jgi:lipoprotein NlpI
MKKASLYLILLFASWLLCDVALAQSPPDAENCAKASGDDETIAACTRLITSEERSSSNLASTFHNRGTAWGNKGDYDRAIADFNEAIRLNPQLADAYHNRGVAWRNKGDVDRAIGDYNEAIRLNWQYALAYYNRGVTRFAQGQFEFAEADFSAALRLNPFDAYLVIWRYFAQSRADHRVAAASDLAANAAKFDRAKWPAPILDLIAGRTDADRVLKAVANSDQKTQRQMCEATFFVGEWYVLQGRWPEARASLEQAERDRPRSVVLYFSASAELKQLSQ